MGLGDIISQPKLPNRRCISTSSKTSRHPCLASGPSDRPRHARDTSRLAPPWRSASFQGRRIPPNYILGCLLVECPLGVPRGVRRQLRDLDLQGLHQVARQSNPSRCWLGSRTFLFFLPWLFVFFLPFCRVLDRTWSDVRDTQNNFGSRHVFGVDSVEMDIFLCTYGWPLKIVYIPKNMSVSKFTFLLVI